MFDRLLTKWARRAAWAICAFWLMAAALPVSAQDAAPQKQPEQGVNEDDLFSTDEIQETPPPNTPQGSADDEIFGADDSIVNIQEKTDASVGNLINQESVSFSGELSAKFGTSLLRDYLDGDIDFEGNPYDTSIEGDFLLDIRLREGLAPGPVGHRVGLGRRIINERERRGSGACGDVGAAGRDA